MAEQVIQIRGRPGLLSGLLGCLFGILGIFSYGLLFVPLAAVCSLVGLLRGALGRSASAIGTSLLGVVLCVAGFAASPTLWALVGTATLVSNLPRQGTRTGAVTREMTTPYINDLTQKVVQASIEVNVQLEKFPALEQRYRAVTQIMNDGLARQQSIHGTGQAVVARGQLGVAINQAAVQAEHLHIRVRAGLDGMGPRMDALRRETTEVWNFCLSEVNSSSQGSDPHSTCGRFMEAGCKAEGERWHVGPSL
jgi:hypothetical protein